VAVDGVPGEFGGSALCRSVVGRHHSIVSRCLLRRNHSRPRQTTTIHGVYTVRTLKLDEDAVLFNAETVTLSVNFYFGAGEVAGD